MGVETKTKAVVIPEITNTTLTEIEKEYKDKIESIKKEKSWVRYVIAGGIITGGLFLTSLVAAHIITGAVALFVAGVLGVAGFYGIKLIKAYDPVIRKKIINSQLTALIKEAQEKKIETLMSYLKYLDDYLQEARRLRNKIDGMISQYKSDLEKAQREGKSDTYINEISKMVKTLESNKESIERIVEKAKENKIKFEEKLEIARKKVEYIEKTKDIVDFLQSSNKIDEMLVDESLNKLEEEFAEISHSIKNLAKDIDS